MATPAWAITAPSSPASPVDLGAWWRSPRCCCSPSGRTPAVCWSALGLVVFWLSAQWTRRQKLVASVMVLALLVLPVSPPPLRTGRDVRGRRIPVDPTRRDRCRDLPGGDAGASPPIARLYADADAGGGGRPRRDRRSSEVRTTVFRGRRCPNVRTRHRRPVRQWASSRRRANSSIWRCIAWGESAPRRYPSLMLAALRLQATHPGPRSACCRL